METEVVLKKGDCLNFLQKMPDKSVDIIVTSPPYNLGIKYDQYKDQKADVEYLQFIDLVIIEYKRVLKPKGSLFINVAGTGRNPYIAMTIPMQIYTHLVLQNHIIWVKAISFNDRSYGHYKPINSERYLNNLHESLFYFTKSGKVKIDRLAIGVPYSDKSNIKRRGHTKDLKCAGNIWPVFYPTRQEKLAHPATFPVELAARCIKLHGKKRPVVMDIFGGVMSTGVAAIECKASKFIGIELSKDYIDIGRQRLRRAMKV